MEILVKSLKELNIDQASFPIFFKDGYINCEIFNKSEVLIYANKEVEGLIIFKKTKLKIITKGQFLFSPVSFQGSVLNQKKENELLNRFISFLKDKRIVDILLPPIHFSNFQSIPKNCIFFEIGIIQRKNIQNDTILFQKMKPNYRNEIKKLIDNESIVVSDGRHLLGDSYDLIKNTLREQGITCDSFEFFENLEKNINNQLYISNCYINGEIYGTVIFIYDNNSAYYLYSGNKKTNDFPGINKLLIFKAFIFFQQKGIKNVILGGFRDEKLANSKIIGIQKFKLRFGAEVELGYHFIRVIKPFKYFIFKTLIKLKSKLTGQNLELINLHGLDVKYSRD